MSNIKKVFFALFTIFIVFIFSGCSSGGSSSSTEINDNEKSESAVNEEEVIKINVAYGNQPDEPIGQLAEKWKQLAAERSNGRVDLQLYPSSQLGAEKDVIEQALMGNNVIVMTGYDFLMDYVPDAGILTAPYLVDDFEELLYLTTTDWFDKLRSELKEKNVELLVTNTFLGERHLLTNEEVLTPEDLNGLKIRVPNNQMSIKTFEAMGAAATPTPLGELYTSLQQGLVDGAENPLPTLYAVKAHEVSKYLALTGHQKMIVTWIGGADFIETLPEDAVEILRETGKEASEYARVIQDEETISVLAELEAAGVKVNEIDTEPFKQLVKEVYSSFPEWSPGLYDTIQQLLENR